MSEQKLYDNITLLSLDNQFIGYISKKKANWYISKKLGDMIDENTCQLNFKGNFKGYHIPNNMFKQTNNCAVCNSTHKLTKFSLIHKDLKKILPKQYSSHRSHAIIPVCCECRSDIDSIISEELKELIDLDNYNNYFNNIKIYVDNILKNNISPDQLERDWANRFYNLFDPQYLPEGWKEFFNIN